MNNMHPQSGRLYTMCGIAAISRGPGSTVNMRELAHSLLTQIENRGTHASGFAWYGPNGETGVYKQPKPGSQLSLAELPRNADTVILHTRYATQGSVNDNRNNHPVVSTDENIALVHNGVISNDWKLRDGLGITKELHGEVDSLVIPSLIAQRGEESLSELAGYAAIAWIDGNEDGELHIARLKSSPVAYTHLLDGTFVMASTQLLLKSALDSVSALYGGIFNLDEQRSIEVVDGFILNHYESPRMSYDSYSYGRYSGATAGGHKSTSTTTTTTSKGSEDTTPVKAVSFTGSTVDDDDDRSCDLTVSDYYEDLEKWRKDQEAADIANSSRAAVLFQAPSGTEYDLSKPSDQWTDAEWDAMVERMEAEEDRMLIEQQQTNYASEYLAGEGFYIIDGEGNITHHPMLEDLEAYLRWLAKMTRHEFDIFPNVEDDLNWVNHVMDLGAVTEDGDLVSWVDDMAEMDEWESPAVRNLQHIREGIGGSLVRLKGA